MMRIGSSISSDPTVRNPAWTSKPCPPISESLPQVRFLEPSIYSLGSQATLLLLQAGVSAPGSVVSCKSGKLTPAARCLESVAIALDILGYLERNLGEKFRALSENLLDVAFGAISQVTYVMQSRADLLDLAVDPKTPVLALAREVIRALTDLKGTKVVVLFSGFSGSFFEEVNLRKGESTSNLILVIESGDREIDVFVVETGNSTANPSATSKSNLEILKRAGNEELAKPVSMYKKDLGRKVSPIKLPIAGKNELQRDQRQPVFASETIFSVGKSKQVANWDASTSQDSPVSISTKVLPFLESKKHFSQYPAEGIQERPEGGRNLQSPYSQPTRSRSPLNPDAYRDKKTKPSPLIHPPLSHHTPVGRQVASGGEVEGPRGRVPSSEVPEITSMDFTATIPARGKSKSLSNTNSKDETSFRSTSPSFFTKSDLFAQLSNVLSDFSVNQSRLNASEVGSRPRNQPFDKSASLGFNFRKAN